MTKTLKTLVVVVERLGGASLAQTLVLWLVVVTPNWRQGSWLIARL